MRTGDRFYFGGLDQFVQPICAIAHKTMNAGKLLATYQCGQHKGSNHERQWVAFTPIVAMLWQLIFQ